MVGEIHMRDSNGQLRPVAMKHGRDADATDLTGVPFDVDLLEEVMESGQGVLRQSEAGDPGLAMDDFHECTICAPMLGAEAGPAGVILLQADGSSDGFHEDDLELVSAIGVLAGQSVGYARSHDIVVEHTNTRRQLETARQIQLGMLPRERPNVPGYEFWHHYAAAERVGGDYFFYEMLRDGRVMFGIADASGKGLSAALNIARFAGEVRFRIATSPTLKSAISSLNGFVIDSSEECMFITACICVLDPHQHLLSLANAGHPAALLKHRGKERVELLQSSRRSFPLGISREFETHPVNVALEPGDEVLLYTDGVSEAMNPLQKLFGTDRLSESFARPHQSIAEVVDGLVQDVMHFREDRLPSDDMTLIALARL
jgi:serine phosphatase RsbU (regulator of sigma subunit)